MSPAIWLIVLLAPVGAFVTVVAFVFYLFAPRAGKPKDQGPP